MEINSFIHRTQFIKLIDRLIGKWIRPLHSFKYGYRTVN